MEDLTKQPEEQPIVLTKKSKLLTFAEKFLLCQHDISED